MSLWAALWRLVLILAASMSLWAALFWAFPSSG
jgi:hypothetical protein